MTLDCQRCGNLTSNPLLLNHRTKTRIKVVQLCESCCRDMVIGLVRNRRVPFGYALAFQKHFQKPEKKR